MNEYCNVIKNCLFEKSGVLDDSMYRKLSTDSVNVIYNVPYLTMMVIEEEERWVFHIKMSIKDNRDFFDTLKLNGFKFKSDIEDDFREKFEPIHRQKDFIKEKLNIHVEYVIEHMFYFTKTHDLYEQWSSCTHDINGAYLFLHVKSDDDGEPLYTYFGYHNQNLVNAKYKVIPEYEFCVLYLKQQFHAKGEITTAEEINADNFLRYFALLNMVDI